MTEFLTCSISEISEENLKTIVSAVEGELRVREQTKNTRAIQKWATQQKGTFDYALHSTTRGWLAVLVIFHCDKFETFSASGETREVAKETVSKLAIESSCLDGISELYDDPMELM